jgi:lipopolysaccharide/colanic/teichoic acid biosynthesis glycosyltransferase
MSKEHIQYPKGRLSRTGASRWWGSALAGAVSALAAALCWLYLERLASGAFAGVGAGGDWWRLLALAATHGFLALSLVWSLSFPPLEPKWNYRAGFILSGVFPLAYALASALGLAVGGVVQWPWAASAAVGALGGALLGTGLREGFWENNSPPPSQIQEAVYRRHRELIGRPGPPPTFKRLFDILLALVGGLLSAPIWLLSAFIVWWEDPGPLLFVKNSVGKGGRNFHQFKLRTMVRGAETHTGPVLASQGDDRVLGVGRVLRKTALDELPQLINILTGEMSFVGPRPQRTVLVQGYLERMPEYAQRHEVLPGLSGLAQVAGDYYLTPRQKLRFDRLYIRYTGLGFDLKLILLACMITFWYRWQAGWTGRLPRNLLRMGARRRRARR